MIWKTLFIPLFRYVSGKSSLFCAAAVGARFYNGGSSLLISTDMHHDGSFTFQYNFISHVANKDEQLGKGAKDALHNPYFENGAADDEGQLEGGDGTTDIVDVEDMCDRGDEYEYGGG